MTADRGRADDRVFVIMRIDGPTRNEALAEPDVALLKALWSEAAAETEVQRLNAGKHEHGARYFWKAVRLERRAAAVNGV